MISEEVLKKLADGLHPKYCDCPEYEYGEFETLIVEMANEILTYRENEKILSAEMESLRRYRNQQLCNFERRIEE